MGIETLTRSAKTYYEQLFAQQRTGVDTVLFPISDEDTSDAFLMDRLIQSPAGIVYRDKDNESHVRPYTPGSGTLYEVPIASEKTRIGEELRGAIAAGIDPTSPQVTHLQKIHNDIIADHVSGHNMTKWKQALDVIFDGEFYAKGSGGADINLGINYDRAAANELTPNFATTDQPAALKAMQDQLIAKGSPTSNMIVIMGAAWIDDFFNDTAVLAFLDSNQANILMRTDMIPKRLVNQDSGLVALAAYRAPNMVAPVYVCSYSPGGQYKAYPGASPTDWTSSTKAAMLSLDSPRYRVKRGITILDANEQPITVAGELVFDSYTTKDPVGTFVRSTTRHIFVPGNIDHTVVATGTGF